VRITCYLNSMCFLHVFLIALIKKHVLFTCLKDTCSFYMWVVGNLCRQLIDFEINTIFALPITIGVCCAPRIISFYQSYPQSLPKYEREDLMDKKRIKKKSHLPKLKRKTNPIEKKLYMHDKPNQFPKTLIIF